MPFIIVLLSSIMLTGCRSETTESCPEIYQPVCGTVKRTHDNACLATANCALSNTNGECAQESPKTIALDKCSNTETCAGEEKSPVCGTHKKTFTNECNARAEGITSFTEGECED